MHKPIIMMLCLSLLLTALPGCSDKKNLPPVNTEKVSAAQPQPPTQVNPPLPEEGEEQQDAVPLNATTVQEQQETDIPEQTPEVEVKVNPANTTSPKQYSLKAGDYFPQFNLLDFNGTKFNSVDTFAANKVTLVNFWGTFCGPCIREMPALEQLRQNYAGQGLGIIGIVLDSNKAKEAKLMAGKLGTGYPHLLDDGRYNPYIYAVPQTLLVDSEGKVLVSVVGARSIQQFINMVEPYLK